MPNLPKVKFHGKDCFLCRTCAKPLPLDQVYKGKRIMAHLKRYFDAMPASKFCEPCARKLNEQRPGIFRELKRATVTESEAMENA